MNRRVVSRYEMFSKVVTFGKQNAVDFAPKGLATTGFAALEDIVNQLRALQAGLQDSATLGKAVLMDGLRLDAKNIWRTAYAIGQVDPAFGARFKQPEAGGEAPLLLAVDALIAELEKPGVAERFIAHELPESFVADLKESRASAMAAKSAVESDRQSNIQSTTSMDRLVAEGLQHVTTLNAIMHNKYSAVPEKLRAWKSAIHIERPRRSRSGTGAEGEAESATPAEETSG